MFGFTLHPHTARLHSQTHSTTDSTPTPATPTLSHTLPHTLSLPNHIYQPSPAINECFSPTQPPPPQTPNQQHPPSHSEMCIRVVERFAVCNCVYYVHGVDQCGAYGRRGHEIEDRNVPVGHTCPEHAAQGYQHGRMPVPSGDRHMGVLPDTFGSSGSSYSYGGYHSSGSHR